MINGLSEVATFSHSDSNFSIFLFHLVHFLLRERIFFLFTTEATFQFLSGCSKKTTNLSYILMGGILTNTFSNKVSEMTREGIFGCNMEQFIGHIFIFNFELLRKLYVSGVC